MQNSLHRNLTDETSLPVGDAPSSTPNHVQQRKLLNLDQYFSRYGADAQTGPSEERQWQNHVMDALVRYAALPTGWDSYSGKPIRWDVGAFAMCVLSSVMRSRTPLPQLVPSSEGAIQVEWHEKQIDLELYVTAPYSCEVSFHDHRNGVSWSEELSTDFSGLTGPISELTIR